METNHPPPCRPAVSRLASLRRRIEAWRSTCAGPQGRMPEHLWREAVLLGDDLGVERVASSLELNRSALERRLSRLESGESIDKRPVFLDLTPEIKSPLVSGLEILARDGTSLRYQGPLEDLRSLVLSILEHAP